MTTPNGPEATIIPFPVRARAAAPAAGQDHERLSRALGHLSEALSTQQHAIARWRARLDDLHGAVGHLSGNVHTYAGRLQDLGRDVAVLRNQADQLSRMADAMAVFQR